MWGEYGRAGQATDVNNITRRMLIACWIPKATDKHSEYVTLITFPRKQWLSESASMVLHMHTTCLVAYGSSSLQNIAGDKRPELGTDLLTCLKRQSLRIHAILSTSLPVLKWASRPEVEADHYVGLTIHSCLIIDRVVGLSRREQRFIFS
jgi:hypothetical protein